MDGARELQREQGFADADGVDPGPFASGKAFTIRGMIASESLAEFIPVSAAAKHAQQVTWEQRDEGQREKQIVDEQ